MPCVTRHKPQKPGCEVQAVGLFTCNIRFIISDNSGKIHISSISVKAGVFVGVHDTQSYATGSFNLSNTDNKYSRITIESATCSAKPSNINNRISVSINGTSYPLGSSIEASFTGDLNITASAGTCGIYTLTDGVSYQGDYIIYLNNITIW